MRISDWSSDVCSSDLEILVTRCRNLRRVRRKGRDEQEERRIVGGGAADRRGCIAGEHVGQVVLFPVAVADRVAVLVHNVVVVTVAGAVSLVPAGGTVAFSGTVHVHILRSEERRVGQGCCSWCKLWW